jgi:hypothetical protein
LTGSREIVRGRAVLASLPAAAPGNQIRRLRRLPEVPRKSGASFPATGALACRPRFWSVRVTRDYRAVAQRLEGDVWPERFSKKNL